MAISTFTLAGCAGALALLGVSKLVVEWLIPDSLFIASVGTYATSALSSLAAGVVAAWSECSNAKALGVAPRGRQFGVVAAAVWCIAVFGWLVRPFDLSRMLVFALILVANIPVIFLAGFVGSRMSKRWSNNRTDASNTQT